MKPLKRSSFVATAAAVAAVLPLLGLAQPPAAPPDSKSLPMSKVERKGKAPVSSEVLRVNLPKPVEATLDNGLDVMILEDHRVPIVSANLTVIGAGGVFDPANTPGLALATATMLREGTKTRSSKQVAEEVARLGATLNAGSGFSTDQAGIGASGLSDNLDAWFPLMVEVLTTPSFPAEELDKLKQRLKVQLKTQRAQPAFLVNERYSKAIFGSHPGSVVSFTAESIDALTPERLAQWHKERWVPQNAILAIAGDVKASELVPRLNKWLAGWTKTTLKAQAPPRPTPVSGRKIYLVDRPSSVQTTVSMGNIAIDRADPDYIPLTIMNRVVGGGSSARLFLNLREEKGYTYGVYSNLSAGRYPGPWTAGGDMRTDVTDGAMTEFLREIQRIRDEKVPAAELEDAKRSEVARFALTLEQPTAILGNAITRKIYGFPADYWDTYAAKVMAVTPDDVQRVARKYVNPDALQVAAVGDASKIRTVLQKYGPVEVYDTEGRPVASGEPATSAKEPKQ
jgi:zinc protease